MAVSMVDPLDGFDVFDAMTQDLGDGLGDPYPHYAELLAAGSVHPIDLELALGLPSTTISVWDGPPFTVLGYADAVAVMRDSHRFSNRAYEKTVGRSMGRNILTIDAPDHRALRQLVLPAFSRGSMERWTADLIEPLARQQLGALAHRGSAELVNEFNIRFPVQVIHSILGLPDEQLPLLLRYGIGMFLYRSHMDVAIRCSHLLAELLTAEALEARTGSGDSLMHVLWNTVLPTGERLDEGDVVSFLRALMAAGDETTTHLLGSLFARVLESPDRWEEVCADESIVLRAVDETLRLDAPAQYVYRLCCENTEIGGVMIPSGALVAVGIAAANRDPSVFDDPDTFDLHRIGSAPVSFGFGAHQCIGMHLARVEACAALRTAIKLFPRLRLDPHAPLPAPRGIHFRSPGRVHVRWD